MYVYLCEYDVRWLKSFDTFSQNVDNIVKSNQIFLWKIYLKLGTFLIFTIILFFNTFSLFYCLYV